MATSAFCDSRDESDYSYPKEFLYISGGYSQSLNGITPVGDFTIGISSNPFDSYGLQVGIDILHFQIAPTDRFQTVSDESLFQLSVIFLTLPLSVNYAKNKFNEWYAYFIGGLSFLMHSSLYFPILPNDRFGVINKHRFVTEIITKGFHYKSFTFQDDLGIRANIHLNVRNQIFIDGGIRFEKNFSRDLEKKWFLQVGFMGH